MDTATPASFPPQNRVSAASQQKSRGISYSRIPDDLTHPQQVAATFVILAATADCRIDGAPPDAWKRANPLATPDLAHELSTQKHVAPSPWWKEMCADDGFIAVLIDNVLGGGSGQEPGSTPDRDPNMTVTVLFHRAYKRDGRWFRDMRLHEWTVTPSQRLPCEATRTGPQPAHRPQRRRSRPSKSVPAIAVLISSMNSRRSACFSASSIIFSPLPKSPPPLNSTTKETTPATMT